jgi:S-formylglutathione hydrolase FrmB
MPYYRSVTLSMSLRRLSIFAAAACFVLVWAGAVEGRQLEVDTEMSSVALGGSVHALVVLPQGYPTSGKRYPVVYFLHGLPGSPSSYRGSAWVAEVAARVGPSIIVEPQGARDGDSDAEYLDWGTNRNWSTYLTRELPRYIDSHFRTIRSRSGRAIVGISAGGYGAAMLGLNDLDEFSVIESWSGYFHATDPSGTKAIAAPASANVHNLLARLAADEQRRATFLGFYIGKADSRFLVENEQFADELTRAGIQHTFALYDGAHENALWRRQAERWLRLALDHLLRPA